MEALRSDVSKHESAVKDFICELETFLTENFMHFNKEALYKSRTCHIFIHPLYSAVLTSECSPLLLFPWLSFSLTAFSPVPFNNP